LYGKGLAAGLAIVLLGVMLDRITQAAARRTENFTTRGDKR
jgi:glycine betaine/proline transport system permease protein